MPTIRPWTPFLFLLVGGSLAAQRTFIVDHAGGAGVDFTDLPAALAAARSGDTVRVRAHALAYTPATTSSGIKLLGDGGPTITGTSPGLQVRLLPAGEAFVMKGFTCSNAFGTAVTVDSCQGRVHLEGIQTQVGAINVGFSIQQSAAVTITNCSVQGGPALQVVGSTVAVIGSRLDGASLPTAIFPLAAMTTNNSRVVLSGTNAFGGNGQTVPVPIPGSAAIIANNASAIDVRGDATTSIQSGFSGTSIVAGITVNGSTLALDPSVRVIGPPAGTGTITTRRSPALLANGVPPGGNVTATLYSPAGDLVLLLVAAPARPLAAPPFGDLWIDPLAILQVLASTQGSSQHWVNTLPVPAGLPRGTVVGLQGLSGTGTDLRLTNPAPVVVH